MQIRLHHRLKKKLKPKEIEWISKLMKKKLLKPIDTEIQVEDIVQLIENEPELLAPEVSEEEQPKKKVNKLKLYFHSGTQDAIVVYQTETDNKKKNKLYETEIAPAFEKLAENLINIHKFSASFDSFDDLKSDCVNFLFETILKFDATRGTNAFSYFNVVAKNFLIIQTKRKLLRTKRSVSLDDVNALSANEHKIIEDHITITQESALDNRYATEHMMQTLYEIRSKAKSENELACINSIITIFENINDLDILNKSGILLYLRELSGLSPKQLTTTLQSIKKHFKKMKLDNAKLKLF